MLPRSMRANNGFVIMLPAREAIHKRVCTGNSCVEVLQFVCNRVNLQSNKVNEVDEIVFETKRASN